MRRNSCCVLLVPLALVASLLISTASAIDTDGDGLLDLIDVPGFDANATGVLSFESQHIQDLDGANVLTNLQGLSLDGNQITSIESGDFDGLTNLRELWLGNNQFTSIESGAFDELTNLQELWLVGNQITSIESGVFSGLANLRWLSLEDNPITSFDAGAFSGLTNMYSLFLTGSQITELNFAGATFEELAWCFGVFGRAGFCLDDGNGITSLVLNNAVLSHGAFDAIVLAMPTSLTDVSLVGLTFSDQNPSDLNGLLGIAMLDNVVVDQALFDLYADELGTFAAVKGNSVTVVPEPASVLLAAFAGIGLLGFIRRGFPQRRQVIVRVRPMLGAKRFSSGPA